MLVAGKEHNRTYESSYSAIDVAPGKTSHPESRLLTLRQIEHRIRPKKVKRTYLEGVPHGRHHRPILHPRHMVEAKRVPADQIGVFNWPVGLRPHRQSIRRLAARRIDPGCIALSGI